MYPLVSKEVMLKNPIFRSSVISFIDIYKKVERNFPSVREVMKENRIKHGREIIKIDSCYGTVKPCAEGDELAQYGADCSGCMTVKLKNLEL